MASYRHLLRTCIVQTIFAVEFRGDDGKKILNEILAEFAPKITDDNFARETLDGILKNKSKILKIIERFAPDWPIDKIARIDRAILELGVYEIVYARDIPPIVAINESVEIAKHFGDQNSSRFINGVLSSVMKAHE